MHFGNPQALWLLILWPFLAALGWAALRRQGRVAARLGTPAVVARLYPTSVATWRRRRLAVGLAAMALLMLAAARPQYGEVERTIRAHGTNVLIALDCSKSMLAEDVAPNRLEAARGALGWLLRSLEGNRVGVMAFAGDAIVNCPMTLDSGMAGTILKALDTTTIGAPGTDLGRAIDVATGAFERGAGQGGRVLVLVTDGEDLGAKALEAARRAAQKGIVIDAIGIGAERGAPLRDENGGFKEDASGAKVNSRLRMDILAQATRATGGVAIEAGADPQAAIDQVAACVAAMQKAEMETRRRVVRQDRFVWAIVPALMLLAWLLADRPRQPDIAAT
jgi:Ca-activated chloride channel family protein